MCSQESIMDQTWARTCPGDSDGETLSRSCRSWRTPERADVPTFTHQTTLASQLATPQNWTHYPNSFHRPPITFSLPPSLDSTPTLTDFTYLCSPSSGTFPQILSLAIIYTYPAAPLHPSCFTSHLYHLQIQTSITYTALSPVRLSSHLFSYVCEFSPFRKAASPWTLSSMIQMSLLIDSEKLETR